MAILEDLAASTQQTEGCIPYKVPSVLKTTMSPCRGWQLLLQSLAGGNLEDLAASTQQTEGCMPYKEPSVLTTTISSCRRWQLFLQSSAGGNLGGPGCQQQARQAQTPADCLSPPEAAADQLARHQRRLLQARQDGLPILQGDHS